MDNFVDEASPSRPRNPRLRESAQGEPLRGGLPGRPAADSGSLPPARILVADDNAGIRTSVTRLLGLQYHVEAVADGVAALRSVEAHPPDLILCDVLMPQMDGFELLRALQSDPKLREIPVILLSARSDEVFKLHGLEEGAADYLTKPFTPRELMGRIGAHLKLARIRSAQARREIEARTAAEEANRSKAKFLTTISHELRTPLNAIAGYVEILQMGVYGPVTEEQRQALQRIQKSQRHVLSLMNDVLDFAKLEAGRTSFAVTEISLHETLAELETMVAPQLIKKGIHYAYEPCEHDAGLRVDEDRLRQVTLNLLTNAIKFTPEDGLVRLCCDCGAHADQTIILVRDSGIGIPPEMLDTIFEPFVQVDPGDAEESKGTGLGLAISRDLARAMGGTLTAASTPGDGSTFTLTIPRRPDVGETG